MFGDWAAEETPYTGYLPYLTAKAAIHFMTRGLAAEVAPFGVRVNCIAPGPTMRPPEISVANWNRAIVDKAPLKIESSVPRRRRNRRHTCQHVFGYRRDYQS